MMRHTTLLKRVLCYLLGSIVYQGAQPIGDMRQFRVNVQTLLKLNFFFPVFSMEK